MTRELLLIYFVVNCALVVRPELALHETIQLCPAACFIGNAVCRVTSEEWLCEAFVYLVPQFICCE